MEKTLYKKQADNFLKWINDNYKSQKDKLIAFCNDKKYEWNEDIFCDTYLKIYEKILKCGINDDSDKGFDNYMFISFKINTLREAQYSRNQKRDNNIVNLSSVYENWFNANSKTEKEKLIDDLRKDFFTLYLMHIAEEHFDAETFYLFRLKTFEKITYKQLQEKTGIKDCRQKVVNVKNYLKENVKKEDVQRIFEEQYGEFFEF